jgi:hypothetical protein
LDALLGPPTESPVPEDDYRYHFIYNIPRKDMFDDLAKDTFDALQRACTRKKSAASIDLFVNQMMTTGLELYVSSETEISQIPILYIQPCAHHDANPKKSDN